MARSRTAVYNNFSFLPGPPGKRNLAHLIARHVKVQTELSEVTANAARRARALLAHHRHDGHAEILHEKRRIDHYVILSDERGLEAAMSIEFGRNPDKDGEGGSTPTNVLHDAFRLPKRR